MIPSIQKPQFGLLANSLSQSFSSIAAHSFAISPGLFQTIFTFRAISPGSGILSVPSSTSIFDCQWLWSDLVVLQCKQDWRVSKHISFLSGVAVEISMGSVNQSPESFFLLHPVQRLLQHKQNWLCIPFKALSFYTIHFYCLW